MFELNLESDRSVEEVPAKDVGRIRQSETETAHWRRFTVFERQQKHFRRYHHRFVGSRW